MHDRDKPHTHEHTHGHHEHEYTHGHDRPAPPLVKILGYMRAHNEEHANETADIAKKLAESGHEAEAKVIEEGLALIRAGNAKVAEALAALENADAGGSVGKDEKK
ncbi:MAG: hypothetical protein LBC58_02325 [Clostridiales Family XIII bacterium]|jgi:hypothetical protein|nr:hypothetical protein [Clostridiales Family XIII bacterium]